MLLRRMTESICRAASASSSTQKPTPARLLRKPCADASASLFSPSSFILWCFANPNGSQKGDIMDEGEREGKRQEAKGKSEDVSRAGRRILFLSFAFCLL